MRMQAKKSLGQNFLASRAHVRAIADAGEVRKGDVVLEVGPGRGILTEELLARGARVAAVEKDDRLIEPLKERFVGEIAARRLKLFHGDILELTPKSLGLKTGKFKVVANIPYYITGAFLRQMLSGDMQPSHMTLLLQKEVVERIARSKKESLLSLSVKIYGVPRYARTVPRGAFFPAPNVDSAILSISDVSRSHFKNKKEEARFFTLLHAGFAQKRKYLVRNLETVATPEKLRGVFALLHINPKVRAEELSLADWLSLARCLD